jgi:hypothetical protein
MSIFPLAAAAPIVNPVVKSGVVAPLNNATPVPFSSVSAARKFALEGVVTNVSIPAARVIAAHEVKSASAA